MPQTHMPRDQRDHPIPCLKIDGQPHKITITGVTARNTTAFDAKTRIVSLYATVPVFLKQGDANVEATVNDHYFPAGIYYDIAIGSAENDDFAPHIAFIKADGDGVVYISEKS